LKDQQLTAYPDYTPGLGVLLNRNPKWRHDGLVCFEMFRNVFGVRHGQGVADTSTTQSSFEWFENGVSVGTGPTYEAADGHGEISVEVTFPNGSKSTLTCTDKNLVSDKP
jgi:hypothetical protein